ncbi:MAG: tetratricopeptide repeat protein [Candidatus Omnitrophota bacterium]
MKRKKGKFKNNLSVLPFTLCFLLFNFYFLLSAYAGPDITEAEKLFLEGRYENAASAARALIKSGPRKAYEVYYLKGLSELKLNKFGDARGSFRAIIDKYPGSPRVFDANVGIGDSYFLEGRKDGAAKIYNEILRNFPNDKNIVIVKSRIRECDINASDEEQPGIMPRDVPRGESSGYASVQVGSFKNSRNADRLARKLSIEGFDSFIEVPAGSGDRLYRVKAGKLQSKDSAEALASRLMAKGYNTKICLKQ